MTYEEKVAAAERAINDVFSDMSVTKRKTLDAMMVLYDLCEANMDALLDDIRNDAERGET